MRSFYERIQNRSRRFNRAHLLELNQSLLEHYLLFKTLFEEDERSIFIINNEGYILFANKRARIHKKLSRRLNTYRISQLIPYPQIVQELPSLLKNLKDSYLREYYIEESNIFLELSLHFISSGSRPSIVCLLSDISATRKIQAQLSFQQQLAHLGKLSSVLAHELKNPLEAISLHLSLLKRLSGELNPNDKLKFDRYLYTIEDEIARLDVILKNYLNSMRPFEVHLLSQDLKQSVLTWLPLWKESLKERNISLELQLQNTPLILLDFRLFQQILSNLVKNAQDAMPDGGHLLISSCATADKHVKLCMKDTGSGIIPDMVNQIFQPFSTNKIQGTGLGLAISYQIMAAHGGRISWENTEVGARFCLYFPTNNMLLLDYHGHKEGKNLEKNKL